MNEHVDRLEDGVAWEIKLAQKLERWGWATAPFGTATLPGVVSLGRLREGGPPPGTLYQALQSYRDPLGFPSGLRWMPDIIAGRGDRLCLIDAKTERRPSPNYAVEYMALQVGRTIVDYLKTPVFYVWEDGGVLAPAAFVDNDEMRVLPGAESMGSRTPFALLPKRYAVLAHEIFGNNTGG